MLFNRYSGPSFSGMRIGLLGGSFNPAHEGHREMSLHALKRLRLDQVWWLVSPQNPLKPTKGMAPMAERVAKAHAISRHPKILVSDIEAQLGTRYTVDTLRALRKRFPATQFVWLMGADNLGQIPHWRRWHEIFEQVPVAVFRRAASLEAHASAGYGRGKAALRFSKNFRASDKAGSLSALAAPAWLVLDNRLNLISGTAIRRRSN